MGEASPTELPSFKLALQLNEEFRTSNHFSRTCSQETEQSQVDTDRSANRQCFGDSCLALQHQHGIPSRCFFNYPYLLNYHSFRDWSMQVYPHSANFRQFYLLPSNGISFELGEQQRLELPILFKAWEPKTPLLHRTERLIKPCQCLLQYLRVNSAKIRNYFSCARQIALLSVVVGVEGIRRNNVFRLKSTSIYRTFARLYPVPSFIQRIVIDAARLLQPIKHNGFGIGVWINSVAVCKVQIQLLQHF